MAEGINRYDETQTLARRHERELELQPNPDIFMACRMFAEQLTADWGRARTFKHGPAERHFGLHVRTDGGGRCIELRCATAIAYGWHPVRRIARDSAPTVLGHPLRITFTRGSAPR